MNKIQKILVWLPSPMGDAIMATPTLRDIRRQFADAQIYFYASKTVAEVLSPTTFADGWVKPKSDNIFSIVSQLRQHNFDMAILLKNSFASAAAVFLAGIAIRMGYARECRGLLLNVKLKPEKLSMFKYKPVSVIDYYVAIAELLDNEVTNKKMQLEVVGSDRQTIGDKFQTNLIRSKPVVVIVPGGAFGPSKIWPEERFAAVADFLVEKFSANVFISVSPDKKEKQIADKICSLAKHPLVNLADTPITLGQLKALFSLSDLVISNDTGPRHIAIALGKKIVTLFGPNNPQWTKNNYNDEIKIVADVPCSPCDEPVCKKDKHYCMQSITAEAVCNAAGKVLAEWAK